MWLSEPAGISSKDRESLSRRATEIARAAMPGVDVEIFWDGMWVRRVGPDCFPDPDLFRAPEPDWERWAGQARKYLRDAQDYWFYLYKPRPGDTIVDIGAGRGEDVFAFARAVGPAGRVWAIEPHPVSFAALDRLCDLNRLANVTRLQRACMDRPGQLQIETLPVWESNYVRAGGPGPASYPVKAVRFDDLAAECGIDRIDFLKMNIEGAERRALPDCERALARARFVCVAAHDFRAARGEGDQFRTLDFVKDFLAAAGFEITLRDDPRYYVPYHVHGVRRPMVAASH
jgi:FkbM family methyltransferase